MKNFFFSLLSMLVILSACTSASVDIEAGKIFIDGEGNRISHEMIVLGSRLENPYSVENITKAIASLYPTKAGRVEVEPTDYYLRFLPKDEAEYERLANDYGINLIDHPVDYQIVREGDYYHDSSIPEDRITWQYAVVRMSDDFPKDIEYEILDEVYIPENGGARTKAAGMDWAAIEEEAYRITGNAEMLAPATRAGESGVPEGDILIEDACREETAGLKGVLVSCNSFVKFARTYTDENGHYKMDKSFKSKPRYRIVYKNRHGFSLGFNLLLAPASSCTLGKHSPEGVSLTITQDSDRALFSRSVVNNAAYDYYEMCLDEEEGTIKTPPIKLRIWLLRGLDMSSSAMMHHGVLMEEGLIKKYLGEYAQILKVFLPDITLGIKGANDYASIYSRTVHELAHASHYMMVGNNYWNRYAEYIIRSYISSGFVTYGAGTEEDHGYCEVGEMWAYYMQSLLYGERYPEDARIFGTSYWFRPQIFMDLNDRGLNRHKIFNALTYDVKDREMLEKKMISLYPQFKSAIRSAFSRYN